MLQNKLAKREADRRNKAEAKDMGTYEMRPRDPIEILQRAGLIKKPDERKS